MIGEWNSYYGDEPPIVWVTYHHDCGVHVVSVHDSEVSALRAAVNEGWLRVAPVPFGADVTSAVKAYEEVTP